MDLEKLKNFLLKNPEYEEYLKKIYEYTEKNPKKMFTWEDVGVETKILKKFVSLGILTIPLSTNRKKYYIMPNEAIEMVKQYFEYKDKILKLTSEYTPDEETLQTIFKEIDEEIIGNEVVKDVVKRFLKVASVSVPAKKRLHILLYGPPASGKSLIGEIISKHLPEPYCVYITATDLSAAGLFNLLSQSRPKILIIDEIDKIKSKDDLDTLHSLMWEGRIRRTKGDYITNWIELDTKVLGIANEPEKLRDSILSRFLKYEMNEPTKNEFIEICVKAIKSENPDFDEELAKYIAAKIFEKCKDVRQAVMIANLMPENKKEVDKFVEPLR